MKVAPLSKIEKVLIIQTAFIGDVILATSLVEEIKSQWPDVQIDFLLRKGNENLLSNHPFIRNVFIWDKKKRWTSFLSILRQLRTHHYDVVFNLQRFFTSGLFTFLSKAKKTVGFDSNPMSVFFNYSIEHKIPFINSQSRGGFLHEVQRNHLLLSPILGSLYNLPMDPTEIVPKLYVDQIDLSSKVNLDDYSYVVLAPTSVWFTKQWQKDKWEKLAQQLVKKYKVVLIGAKSDHSFCEEIIDNALIRDHSINLCGKLNLLESAKLMSKAKKVIVNDSAPLHLASSVNAPTIAIFCSTIPAFGFTPLADNSMIFEVKDLVCRPCGSHGKMQCPLQHYHCSEQISVDNIVNHV